MRRTAVVVALLGALVPASSAQTARGVVRPRASLERLVIVGDSLSAGFQSAGLAESGQEACYGALVAAAAQRPLTLPRIGEPGIPNQLELLGFGPPPQLVEKPGVSPGRLNPLDVPTNLAVTGHDVFDALTLRPDAALDDITDQILGFPGLLLDPPLLLSQVEAAELLQPTTLFVWIGSNDALSAALDGDATLLTPLDVFEDAYVELLDRLSATGAALVVANVPDVTVIPYLFSIDDASAFLTIPPEFLVGPVTGLEPTDLVTLPYMLQLFAVVIGAFPGPMPEDAILDVDEVRTIRERTEAFNAVIARQVERHGAALVDTNAVLTQFDDDGVQVGSHALTTDFFGGIFSLDGVHPTNTGQALVANAFLRALRARFGLDVPPIDAAAIADADPLVFDAGDAPSSGWLTPDATSSLRAMVSVLTHRAR